MINEDGVPVSGCSMLFLSLSVACFIAVIVILITMASGS
jgi:hypothetical protein